MRSGPLPYFLEGPVAGSDIPSSWASSRVPESGRLQTNAPWLRGDPDDRSGAAEAQIFVQTMPTRGRARAGTLTIAGKNVTVTQAGVKLCCHAFCPDAAHAGQHQCRAPDPDRWLGNIYWLSYASEVFEWVSTSNQIIQVAQAVTDGKPGS